MHADECLCADIRIGSHVYISKFFALFSLLHE